MTTETKGFNILEAKTTPEIYDFINQLINDELPEEYILGDWILINGGLYVHWNPKNNVLTVAQKDSDMINKHLFEHGVKRIQLKVTGKQAPDEITYDREEGKTVGIKYVGSSFVQLGAFEVER